MQRRTIRSFAVLKTCHRSLRQRTSLRRRDAGVGQRAVVSSKAALCSTEAGTPKPCLPLTARSSSAGASGLARSLRALLGVLEFLSAKAIGLWKLPGDLRPMRRLAVGLEREARIPPARMPPR